MAQLFGDRQAADKAEAIRRQIEQNAQSEAKVQMNAIHDLKPPSVANQDANAINAEELQSVVKIIDPNDTDAITVLFTKSNLSSDLTVIDALNARDLLATDEVQNEEIRKMLERSKMKLNALPLSTARLILPATLMEVSTTIAVDALIQCMVYQFSSAYRGAVGGSAIAVAEMRAFFENGGSLSNIDPTSSSFLPANANPSSTAAISSSAMTDDSSLLVAAAATNETSSPGVELLPPPSEDLNPIEPGPGSPTIEPGSPTIEPGSPTIEPGSPTIEPPGEEGSTDLVANINVQEGATAIVTGLGVTMGMIASGLFIGAAVYMSYKLWRKCRDNMAAYRNAVASAYQFHETTVRLKSIMDYMIEVLSVMKLTLQFDDIYDALKDIYKVFDRITTAQSHRETLKNINDTTRDAAYAASGDIDTADGMEFRVMDDANATGAVIAEFSVNDIGDINIKENNLKSSDTVLGRIKKFFVSGKEKIINAYRNVIVARWNKFWMVINRNREMAKASARLRAEDFNNAINKNKATGSTYPRLKAHWDRFKTTMRDKASNFAVTIRMVSFDEDEFTSDLTAAIGRLNTAFMLGFAEFTLITNAHRLASPSGEPIKLTELESYKCMLRRTVYSPVLGIRSLMYACATSPDSDLCSETLGKQERWKKQHIAMNAAGKVIEDLKVGIKTLFGPKFKTSYKRIISLFFSAMTDTTANLSFNTMFHEDYRKSHSSATSFYLLINEYVKIKKLLKGFNDQSSDYFEFSKSYARIFSALDTLQSSIYNCFGNSGFESKTTYFNQQYASITAPKGAIVMADTSKAHTVETKMDAPMRSIFGDSTAVDGDVSVTMTNRVFKTSIRTTADVKNKASLIIEQFNPTPSTRVWENPSEMIPVDESFFSVFNTTVAAVQLQHAEIQSSIQADILRFTQSGKYADALAGINRMNQNAINVSKRSIELAIQRLSLPIEQLIVISGIPSEPGLEMNEIITLKEITKSINEASVSYNGLSVALSSVQATEKTDANRKSLLEYEKALQRIIEIYNLMFGFLKMVVVLNVQENGSIALTDTTPGGNTDVILETTNHPKIMAIAAASIVTLSYLLKRGAYVFIFTQDGANADFNPDTFNAVLEAIKNKLVRINKLVAYIEGQAQQSNVNAQMWVLSFYSIFTTALNYTHVQSRLECLCENFNHFLKNKTDITVLTPPNHQINFNLQIKAAGADEHITPLAGENPDRAEKRKNDAAAAVVVVEDDAVSYENLNKLKKLQDDFQGYQAAESESAASLAAASPAAAAASLAAASPAAAAASLAATSPAAAAASLAATSPAAAESKSKSKKSKSKKSKSKSKKSKSKTAASRAAAAASLAAASPAAAAASLAAASPAAAAASLMASPQVNYTDDGNGTFIAGGSRRARRQKYKRNCSCKHTRHSKSHHKRSRRNHKKRVSRYKVKKN